METNVAIYVLCETTVSKSLLVNRHVRDTLSNTGKPHSNALKPTVQTIAQALLTPPPF